MRCCGPGWVAPGCAWWLARRVWTGERLAGTSHSSHSSHVSGQSSHSSHSSHLSHASSVNPPIGGDDGDPSTRFGGDRAAATHDGPNAGSLTEAAPETHANSGEDAQAEREAEPEAEDKSVLPCQRTGSDG